MLRPSSDKPKVDLLTNKIPIVIVSKQAIKKMKVYIDECDQEIGWLGTAYKHGNAYIIDDVILFDQEVHSSTTEITPEGLSSFGEKILNKEGGIELWNSIKVWGHSHVNMPTFASSQDDEQMEVFSDCGHDYFIRIIGNKKGEMRIDLYDYNTGVIYNYIPWIIEKTEEELKIEKHIKALQEEIKALEKALNDYNTIEDSFKEVVKEEIEEKVKSKIVITYFNRNYGFGSGTVVIDSEDKKKEEEEKKISFANPYVEEWILEELSDCYTLEDAKYVLDLYGYEDVFDDKQIRDLMFLAERKYREGLGIY